MNEIGRRGLVIVVCGAVWLVVWQFSRSVFAGTEGGTALIPVMVPAGVQLILLLIARLWGAAGVSLVFPVAALQAFPDAGTGEIVTCSLVAGFAPYLAVVAVCRLLGVSSDLGTLRQSHLPLIAGAASLGEALSYTLALRVFGRISEADFLQTFGALAVASFLACLAVILLVKVAILLGKSLR